MGTLGARTGFTRDAYKVTPGLYCVGTPGSDAPVLVTCNYKLSFDNVRSSLPDIDAWLLVADTRGINVWCAAGKGTFSAEEIAYQVHNARLSELVSHRRLILPQLAANGVAAHKLKSLCGFRGVFGPVYAKMITDFLKKDAADEDMRTITFTFGERAVLVPLEICMLWKPLLIMCVILGLLSGISPPLFSWQAAWSRGGLLMLATLTGIFTGAVVTPLLLPWLPARQFWLKGIFPGLLGAALFFSAVYTVVNVAAGIALLAWISAVSSYMAMNFTGSTPYTSLSGVAKEMRSGLAVQIISAFIALLLWVTSPFL